MPQPSYNPWATPMFPNTGSAFGVGSPAEASERQPTFVDSLLSHIAGALGRGFMAPGQALNSTTPITSEQMIAPAQDMSTMMSAGAGAVPAQANELRMGIKAYHGSPHDFDRFDLSKIGTGEGAQAYGHGLYFAENEGVARSYRDALTQAVPTSNGRVQSTGSGKFNVVDDFGVQAGPFNTKEEAIASMTKQQGKMYEVNLNADPAHFLDWDKKVRDMPAEMQQRLFDKGLAEPHGGDIGSQIYHRRVDQFGPAAATQQLSEAGIPGIRYLDGDSRFAKPVMTTTPYGDVIASHYPPKTSNYVMFDDKLIDILRKYGIAGMTAPPIFAGAMSEQKQ